MPSERSDSSTASSTHGQRYGDWKAPKYDGALLIWPEATGIGPLAQENRRRLDAAGTVHIGGVPLPQLRREMRAFIGHGEADGPVIATGHQTELHHPGVWVKNAVINAAAEASGGRAYHFAVDTDSPKHLKLKWPGYTAALTDDPRLHGAAWSGLLEPPSPAHLNALLDDASSPLLAQFLANCRSFLVDQRDAIAPLDLPSVLTNAEHQLDWSLGLRHGAMLLSGLLESPAWARFVSHIAADADGFAAAYNAALADYRREAGIDDPERPMPDLEAGDPDVEGSEFELPFWLDDLAAGIRWRAAVQRRGGQFVLPAPGSAASGEAFAFGDPDSQALLMWLRRHRLRLSPRALSLTSFMRLIVCDVFVHGIGGGHYDQVTDRLLQSYFNIEPPGFVVATATLFHPDAVGRERVCLPCLKQEGHQLAHAVLGEEKAQWLARIEAADGFHASREIFNAMHEARREAMKTDPAYQAWRRRFAEAQARLAEEETLFDRELFYAVQPQDRLTDLITRVYGEFGLDFDSATDAPE